MNAAMEQLKASYEQGATPEQISEELGFDIVAVKAGLMQCSAKYRKACGLEAEEVDGLNFDNEQLREANAVIYQLALSAEDEHLRFKAASYIRDDKKGRKEVVKNMQSTTVNLLQFNEMVKGAREKMKSVLASVNGNQKLIET